MQSFLLRQFTSNSHTFLIAKNEPLRFSTLKSNLHTSQKLACRLLIAIAHTRASVWEQAAKNSQTTFQFWRNLYRRATD